MRLKCPRCKGCLSSTFIQNKMIFKCPLCLINYELKPNRKLKRIGNAQSREVQETRQKVVETEVRSKDERKRLYPINLRRDREEERREESSYGREKKEEENYHEEEISVSNDKREDQMIEEKQSEWLNRLGLKSIEMRSLVNMSEQWEEGIWFPERKKGDPVVRLDLTDLSEVPEPYFKNIVGHLMKGAKQTITNNIYWGHENGMESFSVMMAKMWDNDPDGLIFSICESHPIWNTIIEEAKRRDIELYVPYRLKTGIR